MGAGRFAGRTAVGATRMAARGAVGAAGLTTAAFMGDPDAVVKAAALGLGAAAVGRVKSGITSGVRKGIGALTDSGSGSGGTAGSPARAQAEQPLTEKTFNEFATKFLGYMETLVGLSQDELRAAQNQELRTREMLAEATGQGSVPTSLRKKKKSATDLLKLLGLGALLMALGRAAKGGTIPDLKPAMKPPVKPRPQPRTRTTQRTRQTQQRTTTRQNRRTNRASQQAQIRARQPRPGTPRPSRATQQAEIRASRAARSGAPAKVEVPEMKPGAPTKVDPEQRRGIISNIAQRLISAAVTKAVPVLGTALAVVDAIKDASEGDIVGVMTNAGIVAGSVATLFPPTAMLGANVIATAVIADFLNTLRKDEGIDITNEEGKKIILEEAKEYIKRFKKIADNPKKYEEQLKDVKVASMEQYRSMNPGVFDQLEGTTREERKRIRDIDKQRFDELGGPEGTGTSFSRFREGQEVLRARELEQRAFEEAEGDTTSQELRTDIGTPIKPEEPVGPSPTPSADASGATLQRSSASMAAASDDLSAIAAADDGGSAEVAGSTVVNATGQEIDIAGNDNARADSLADGRNTETMRLKSLVARTMNPDPTFGKAMAKSLVTTA